MADESQNQEPAKTSDLSAGERAELLRLRTEAETTARAKAKAEEDAARAAGEFSKIEQMLKSESKSLAEENAQLKQWKARVESEQRRQGNIAKLAAHAGVEVSPVFRGLVREAEAAGLLKADADASESDLKTWKKSLESLAPDLFKAPERAKLGLVPLTQIPAEDDITAAVIARAKKAKI